MRLGGWHPRRPAAWAGQESSKPRPPRQRTSRLPIRRTGGPISRSRFLSKGLTVTVRAAERFLATSRTRWALTRGTGSGQALTTARRVTSAGSTQQAPLMCPLGTDTPTQRGLCAFKINSYRNLLAHVTQAFRLLQIPQLK